MRVCDVVLNSVWFDPRVRKQLKEYKRQGIETYAVGYHCPRYDEEKVASMTVPTKIVKLSDKYIGAMGSLWKKLYRERLKNKALTEAILETEPDVIHANDFTVLVACYKAAKKRKCVLIYDSHEICAVNFIQSVNRLYGKYVRFMEKRICKKVNVMVCVSNAASEYFASEYHMKAPMVVTNCALADEIVVSEEKNDGFELINHGQFYEGRGYDIMVEASQLLSSYPEIQLAMRGYGRLEQGLRKRATELQAKNIRFYPAVRVEELIPEAAKSRVGIAITQPINLNFKLSVSNKLFEYAAAGLPVIMSDIPEHRYLNEKYDFGLILKEDTPEALAEAAIKLYSDHALYERLKNNAIKLSHEVNWETEFGRLIELERKHCASCARCVQP